MSKYKVIFKAVSHAEGSPAPTWEPGCPVLFTAIQVSRNTETSAAYLQLKATNVSGEDISSLSIEAEIKLSDDTVERLPIEFLDADIPAGAEKALKPQPLSQGNVASCALKIVRADGAAGKWQSQNAPEPIPDRNDLTGLSERALEQRARNLCVDRNDDIVQRAVRDNGDWWVCACGQVNVKRESCCSCKRAKMKLIENENEAKLLADADEFDKSKIVRQKKVKLAAVIAACIAVLAIAASLVYTQVVVPAQEKAAENQRIEEIKEGIASHPVGAKVELGSYDSNKGGGKKSAIVWVVLAKEHDRALLLADDILDAHEFGDGTWESSELKRWLESDFKDAAFSADECGVLDGSPTILSVNETDEYLSKDSGYRVAYATDYAMGKYGVTGYAGIPSSQPYWWTYRDGEAFLFYRFDQGKEAYKAVYEATSEGMRVKAEGAPKPFGVSVNNYCTPSCIGVRPAVWVKL